MIDLKPLLRRALELFAASRGANWHVACSIPILYSGKVSEYEQSALRIITVGLNPSDAEFRCDRKVRAYDFQCRDASEIERVCSKYFECHPYTRWFNAYERVLQPLGASYYGRSYPCKENVPAWWRCQDNRAVHTDLLTPLVTRPTWSKLCAATQRELSSKGVALWRELVGVLKPDLILISVSKKHLSCIAPDSCWRTENSIPEGEPRHLLRVSRLGDAVVVWGVAQCVPFFHFNESQRKALANSIRGYLPSR